MNRIVLFGALVMALSARADDGVAVPEPEAQTTLAERSIDEARPRATPGRVGLVESSLHPVDGVVVTPDEWTGDIERTGRPEWMVRRLEQHRMFLQPFLISPVMPEFSVRLFNSGGWNPDADGADLDQTLYVSAYFLELYAPAITMRDNHTVHTDHFRIGARVPLLLLQHHVLSAFVGANLPVRGTLSDDGGINTLLGYAFGSCSFSAQARAGFGIDRLIDELTAPIKPNLLYDAAIGLRLGQRVQVQVQVDGRRRIGAPGAALRLWPGLRFFPTGHAALSVGASALWWLESEREWKTRRVGGQVDLGYQFF